VPDAPRAVQTKAKTAVSARSHPPDGFVARRAGLAPFRYRSGAAFRIELDPNHRKRWNRQSWNAHVDIAGQASSGAGCCWICAPPVRVVKFEGFLALYQEGRERRPPTTNTSRPLPP